MDKVGPFWDGVHSVPQKVSKSPAFNRLVKSLLVSLVDRSLWQDVPDHLQRLWAHGSSVNNIRFK